MEILTISFVVVIKGHAVHPITLNGILSQIHVHN